MPPTLPARSTVGWTNRQKLDRDGQDENEIKRVLVVGATGSIGRLVVDEAFTAGLEVKVIVRRHQDGATMPGSVETVVADLTDAKSLEPAVQGVDAVVFVHGTYGSVAAAEAVDYGGVRNVLMLADRPLRIVLMTAITVTDRKAAHDWKRRAERLVRVSGHPYTIVRPGWFDMNTGDQQRLVFLQGDRRQSGTSRDGVVARRQLAQVLVGSLLVAGAISKTFELVAERGPAPLNLEPVFAGLTPDKTGVLDAVLDAKNMDARLEPDDVISDMEALREKASR